MSLCFAANTLALFSVMQVSPFTVFRHFILLHSCNSGGSEGKVSGSGARMSGSGVFNGLSESCPLSRRQASILSKKRAAEEQLQQQLELARWELLSLVCSSRMVFKPSLSQNK